MLYFYRNQININFFMRTKLIFWFNSDLENLPVNPNQINLMKIKLV